MTRYRYPITLTIRGPVLSRAVATGRVGIDALALRDDHDDAALPGTLVRGLLREAWQTLGCADLIAALLGGDPQAARKPDKDQPAWRLPRAALHLAERFSARQPGAEEQFRHRVRVEPDTGAVSGGGLFIIDSPFAPGETVRFQGHAVLDPALIPASAGERYDRDDSRAELGRLLQKGLRYIAAVGALKGVGFGRVVGVTVGDPEPIAPTRVTIPAEARRATQEGPAPLALGLRLRPDRPLCFPLPGPKGTLGNRYRSDECIPGTALKAALAHRWPTADEAGRLRERYFDRLRITRAVPVQIGPGARPLAIPYSLAVVDRDEGFDLLDLARDPGLIHRYPRAPRLQPDWKARHHDHARDELGWGEMPPARGLAVHNAIDPDTGTVRYVTDPDGPGGLLFSLETIAPDQHRWLANLTLPAVAPRHRDALVALLQQCLREGLGPLGKTDAQVAVEAISTAAPLHGTSDNVLRDGLAIVTLQTPALLLPPGLALPNANGGDALLAAYRAAFGTCTRGALQLKHFFARQQLGGGAYWWHRFRKRETPYRPVLLTQAGSVFVFSVTPGQDDAAKQVLRKWRDLGLPPHPAAPGGNGHKDWQTNPWLRENGYGEVAINAAIHWRTPPTPD